MNKNVILILSVISIFSCDKFYSGGQADKTCLNKNIISEYHVYVDFCDYAELNKVPRGIGWIKPQRINHFNKDSLQINISQLIKRTNLVHCPTDTILSLSAIINDKKTSIDEFNSLIEVIDSVVRKDFPRYKVISFQIYSP